MEEYTDLLCELIPLLRPDIVIQRLFGISDWDLLIAPNWGLKKTQIQTYMEKEIERRELCRVRNISPNNNQIHQYDYHQKNKF